MTSKCLAGLLAAAAFLLPAAPAVSAPLSHGAPWVVAHRGGALLLPENTFPAFDNAVRLGVDMLEFDMQVTADDQLVITHDGKVNATFCSAPDVAAAPIRSLKLADVLKFDCGSKHRDIYPTQQAVPGTHMPTPDAFFARYRNTKALFYGETKMPGKNEGDVDPVAFARKVSESVHKYGLEDRFILQSADYRTIDAMHEINPRIRTCLLSPWRFRETGYVELARQHHATCLLLDVKYADAAEVQRVKDAGILVFSNVVDTEEAWGDYLAWGADAIFTNDPASLIAYLRSKGVRP